MFGRYAPLTGDRTLASQFRHDLGEVTFIVCCGLQCLAERTVCGRLVGTVER